MTIVNPKKEAKIPFFWIHYWSLVKIEEAAHTVARWICRVADISRVTALPLKQTMATGLVNDRNPGSSR